MDHNTIATSNSHEFMNKLIGKMAGFFISVAEDCIKHVRQNQLSDLQNKIEAYKGDLQHFNDNRSVTIKGSKRRAFMDSCSEKEMKTVKMVKPKHPLSSFFIFYKKHSQQIGEEHGQTVSSRTAKLVAATWKNMTSEEKEPYQTEALLERQKYDEDMVGYREKYSSEIAQMKKEKQIYRLRKKEFDKKKRLGNQKTVALQKQHQKLNEVKREVEEEEREESSQNVEQQSDNEGSLDGDSELDLEDNLSNSLEDSIDINVADIQLKTSRSQQENLQSQKNTQIYAPTKQKKKRKSKAKQKAEQQEQSNGIKRPKCPTSSFLLYYSDKKGQLSKQHGIGMGPKLISFASQVWKKMDPEFKEKYVEEAKIGRDLYHSEMKMLREKHGSEALVLKKGPKKVQRRQRSNK